MGLIPVPAGGAAGVSSPSCDWTREKNKLRSPSASDSPSSEVESSPFSLDGGNGITSPSLVVEQHEYLIVSISTVPLVLPLAHPSPEGQQHQEISGPGRTREQKERQGFRGTKSREPGSFVSAKKSPAVLVDQSVASAANCLFSVSIGGATTTMSSTPTRAGRLKHSSSAGAIFINVAPAFQISRGELRTGRKAVETTETRALVSPCHDIAPRPGRARAPHQLTAASRVHPHEPQSASKHDRPLTKPPTRVYFGYVNLTLPPVNSVTMLVLGRPLG